MNTDTETTSDIILNDFSNEEERLAHLTRLAARGFTRSLQFRLDGFDMTFGHWIFLRILWNEDGLTQRVLSERANLTEPTTHNALVKLEKLGYVIRKNLKGNNRRQHAFLTKRGRDARKILEPLALEVNEVSTNGLSDKEVTMFRKFLNITIENLAKDEVQERSRGKRVPPTREAK